MPVTLEEVLASRDRRAARQQQMLRQYGVPLFCLTMNIPGPEKDSPLIRRGFAEGCRCLEQALEAEHIPVLERRILPEETGCEGYYPADGEPERLKRIAVELEDGLSIGRLWDLDLLAADGTKVTREQLGLPARQCLLCGRPGRSCASRRLHPLPALQARTNQLLEEYFDRADCRSIAALTARALLWEACTTPKPGLVDRWDSGSHSDMDLFTFASSTAALTPYFQDCAALGRAALRQNLPSGRLTARLRARGRCAEGEMLCATGGVNTHKGAIYTAGLLCAAMGRCGTLQGSAQDLLAQAGELAGVFPEDGKAACTAGQTAWKQWGVGGVRAQAAAGFPAVRQISLPALRRALAAGKSLEEAGVFALLQLILSLDDTNLLARGGRAGAAQAAAWCRELLEQEAFPSREGLAQLNRRFVAQNLSPGGCADLLALTFLAYFWEEDACVRTSCAAVGSDRSASGGIPAARGPAAGSAS